ncbi:MAG: flagellar basal body-associated FliL family protein [Bdellovibrio sp.]
MAENKAENSKDSGDKKPKRHMGLGPDPAEQDQAKAFAELPELNVEELDQAIASEDPEFFRQIGAIAKDTSLSMSEVDVSKLDEELYQEILIWRNANGWRHFVYLIIPIVPQISFYRKRFFRNFRRGAQWAWEQLRVGGRKFVQELLGFLRQRLIVGARQFWELLGKALKIFWNYPTKAKFLALVFLGFVGGSLYVVFQIGSKKSFFPDERDLYLRSLAEVADEVITYDLENEVEPFYDNLRSAPNLIYLEKIMVNLKRSSSSGSNPMVAAEFFLEGLTPEVILEIKEKETMIRDHVARVLETYSFDDLDSSNGKEQVVRELTRSISLRLSSGKLKAVRIKTLILKP